MEEEGTFQPLIPGTCGPSMAHLGGRTTHGHVLPLPCFHLTMHMAIPRNNISLTAPKGTSWWVICHHQNVMMSLALIKTFPKQTMQKSISINIISSLYSRKSLETHRMQVLQM